MIIEEIPYILKDGRSAVLRSPREEDIPGMLEYLYASAGETDFVLRYPEECVKYTPEGEKALFDRINASDCEAMLVCIVEGILAGNCQILWSPMRKLRHRAHAAIALRKEFWNQGIGTRMFQELIRIAEEDPEISQMGWNLLRATAEPGPCTKKWASELPGSSPMPFGSRMGHCAMNIA